MFSTTKKKEANGKDKVHKNLLIVFTAIGIVSFTLGAMVNYRVLKNGRR